MDSITWVFAGIVAVFSAARITRLLVFDSFPPMMWIRGRWDEKTGASDWNTLLHCPVCAGFWVSCAVALSGYLSDWGTAWWVVNSIFAISYAQVYVVVYDGMDN